MNISDNDYSLREINSIKKNKIGSLTIHVQNPDDTLFVFKSPEFSNSFAALFLYLSYVFFCISGKDGDFDSAAHFIRIEFQRQNHVPSKVIYPHFTTATDTSNIQVVFQVVMDSILKDNLRSSTLL